MHPRVKVRSSVLRSRIAYPRNFPSVSVRQITSAADSFTGGERFNDTCPTALFFGRFFENVRNRVRFDRIFVDGFIPVGIRVVLFFFILFTPRRSIYHSFPEKKNNILYTFLRFVLFAE